MASTRLILSDGHAGKVIQSFGNFVVGGNLLIGLVIFLILVVIQFVVVSKGANRISEVAARFTLDAMPGKQMAIDAELNAGLINEIEARKRRELITSEAEFYGAMDGAGKFVRGDAVAGLIITVINILGGLAIGIGNGLGAGDALKKYAILTVGDGLVTQIPALLITVASGVLVTKQRGKHQLSREITAQFMLSPRATRIAAFIVGTLGVVPGLPFFPFAIMSGALVAFAAYSARAIKAAPPEGDETAARARRREARRQGRRRQARRRFDRVARRAAQGRPPLARDRIPADPAREQQGQGRAARAHLDAAPSVRGPARLRRAADPHEGQPRPRAERVPAS